MIIGMSGVIFNVRKEIEAAEHHGEEGVPLCVVVGLQAQHVRDERIDETLWMAWDRGVSGAATEVEPLLLERMVERMAHPVLGKMTRLWPSWEWRRKSQQWGCRLWT
jgi:hypothetical protein